MAKDHMKEQALAKYQHTFAKKPIIINGPWYDSSGPHLIRNDPTKNTLYRIVLPLDGEKKKLMVDTYPKYKSEKEFTALCRALANGLNMGIKIQNRLGELGVQHILTFSEKTWVYDAGDNTYIFMATAHLVEPAAIQLSAEDLTVACAFNIMRKTMDILKEVAAQGYAHRNVNPYAINIERDTGEVYLSDFLFAGTPRQTKYVMPCIDCNFTSPEVQTGGFGGIGGDMYSVALMLFALFTGQSILAPVSMHSSFPTSVPSQIRHLIELGMTGLSENVDEFCHAIDSLEKELPLEWNMPIVALADKDTVHSNSFDAEPDAGVEGIPNSADIPPAWKYSGSIDSPATERSTDGLSPELAPKAPLSAPANYYGYDIAVLLEEAQNYDTSTVFLGNTQPGPVPDDRAIALWQEDAPPATAEIQKELVKTRNKVHLLTGILFVMIAAFCALVYLGYSGKIYDILPDSVLTTSYFSANVSDDSSTSEAEADEDNAETSASNAVATEDTSEEGTDNNATDTTELQEDDETVITVSVPTNVMFIVASDGISIQWDTVDDVNGYELQISDVNTFDSDNTLLEAALSNLYTMSITSWDNIYVRVRAYVTDSTGSKIAVSRWSEISCLQLDG